MHQHKGSCQSGHGPNPSEGSADTGVFHTASLPAAHTNPIHSHLPVAPWQAQGIPKDTVGDAEGVIPCGQALGKVSHPPDAPVEIPERGKGRHSHPDNEVVVHKTIVPLVFLVQQIHWFLPVRGSGCPWSQRDKTGKALSVKAVVAEILGLTQPTQCMS